MRSPESYREDIMKTILCITTAALVLGLAACGPKSNEAASSAGNSADNARDAVGNATSNAVVVTREAVTPTPTGQEFADRAARSDAFEIAAAKLVADHAASADVKSFAKKMIAAHTESTAKIKAAAKKADPAIRPDPTLTSDQNDKLTDLGKLNGADFDKKYIAGQVDAHKDALVLMQGYAKDGDVPSLKMAAGEIAPIVQQHLEMAKALDK
jgi:putative membrane protein